MGLEGKMYRLEHGAEERRVVGEEVAASLVSWVAGSATIPLLTEEAGEARAANLRLLALHSRLLGPLLAGLAREEVGLALPFPAAAVALLLRLLETGRAVAPSLRDLELVLELADTLDIKLENMDFTGMYGEGAASEEAVRDPLEDLPANLTSTSPTKIAAEYGIKLEEDQGVKETSISKVEASKIQPRVTKNSTKRKIKRRPVNPSGVNGQYMFPQMKPTDDQAVQNLLSGIERKFVKVPTKTRFKGIDLEKSLKAGLITISVNKGDKEESNKIDRKPQIKTTLGKAKPIIGNRKSIYTVQNKSSSIGNWKINSRNKDFLFSKTKESIQRIPFDRNAFNLNQLKNTNTSVITPGPRPLSRNITKKGKTGLDTAQSVVNGKSKSFRCKKCGETFKEKKSFKVHLVTHFKYSCLQCDKKFQTPQAVTLHMPLHSETRPFSCELCGKGFNQKGNMNTHKVKDHGAQAKEHTEEVKEEITTIAVAHNGSSTTRSKKRQNNKEPIQPMEMPSITPADRNANGKYPCDKCKFESRANFHLTIHKLAVHLNYMFSCDQCSYQNKYEALIKNHKAAEHEGAMFTCDQCDYKNGYKLNMYQHKKARHGSLKRSTNQIEN